METDKKAYSVWLDAIRGLAALTVFLCHAREVLIASFVAAVGQGDITARAVAPGQPADQTNIGHTAVIVFFVLSGYLVGGGAVRSLKRGCWSASRYAIARMARLWTVLIPALLIGYALDHLGVAIAGPGSIYSGPQGQRMIVPGLLQTMSFGNLLLNGFFLQGIIGRPFGTNSPLWTLSFEFWFYVAFPFLMFIIWPSRDIVRKIACAFTLVAIGMFVGPKISLYFCFWLLGVLVEIIPARLSPKIVPAACAAGSLAFAALLIALLKAKFNVVASDAIEAAAFALLCFAIVHKQQKVRTNIVALSARWLAAISYTLYLTHAPLIVFVDSILMPVWSLWPVTVAGLFKFGCVVMGVFGCSVLLYNLFERHTTVVRGWLTILYVQVMDYPAREDGRL